MPIQRAEPLVHQVYNYIKNAILNGTLIPGEKIVETKLAMDLHVSRSPVREAIRLLTTEALLTVRDGAICVFEPTLEDLLELYDLRLALEPVAAANAASVTRNVPLMQQLVENLQRTRETLQANNMEHLLTLNSEFHQTIWCLSGNNRFYHVLENVSQLIHFYCSIVLNINNKRTNILAEHEAIFTALDDGDSDGAYTAMKEHIEKDLRVIRTYATVQLP